MGLRRVHDLTWYSRKIKGPFLTPEFAIIRTCIGNPRPDICDPTFCMKMYDPYEGLQKLGVPFWGVPVVRIIVY